MYIQAVVVCFATAAALAQQLPTSPPSLVKAHAAGNGLRLTGPFTHENLTLFLVHGPDMARGAPFLTLQEAMQQKKIRVHETGQVNQLSVENVSDEQIFIQSGDIVRGGKQDRILANDLVVEAHSGKVPIASFCVEQGRWTRRGAESATQFGSSKNQAPSNAVKLAAKLSRDQNSVWSGVARSQEQLSANLKADVAAADSATSLQLTLENRAVQAKRDAFFSSLSKSVDGKPDTMGVVVMIDAKPYSSDVYNSHDLFIKLWPKLLEAAVIQSIASPATPNAPPAASADEAWAFLASAERERPDEKTISRRLTLVTRQNVGVASFETIDSSNPAAPLHHNCMRKEAAPPGQPAPNRQQRQNAPPQR